MPLKRLLKETFEDVKKQKDYGYPYHEAKRPIRRSPTFRKKGEKIKIKRFIYGGN